VSAQSAIGTSSQDESDLERSAWRRWLAELSRLALSLVPEYVILILLLGAVRARIFALPAAGHTAISGLGYTAAMVVAGTLFAIPTAAEIPIVQTMMAAGMGIAPATALLVTLPTVSLPSLAMMSRALPARVLIAVGLMVAATGVLAAFVAYTLAL